MKRDWFERSFLEHAVKARSQYDETCRRMAQQILDLLDEAGQRTPLHVEGERCGALSTAWECDKPPGHDGFHVFSEVRALGRVLTAAPPTPEVQAGEARFPPWVGDVFRLRCTADARLNGSEWRMDGRNTHNAAHAESVDGTMTMAFRDFEFRDGTLTFVRRGTRERP